MFCMARLLPLAQRGGYFLEVGGVLQHSALVARELSRPCVAGIADIFVHLHDGQLVEVDGMHEIVSIIDGLCCVNPARPAWSLPVW